ncbi:MAG: membrane protein [Phycisphaerae bacterium]
MTRPATQVSDDASGNKLKATPNDVHLLILHEGSDLPAGRPCTVPAQTDGELGSGVRTCVVSTSRVVSTPFPFNDLVPSWNVDVPPGAGFAVELRVGRKQGDFWTPFYYLGAWGQAPPVEPKVLRDASGFINIDYFQSTHPFDRVQYRFRMEAGDDGKRPVVRRVALACSNTLNHPDVARVHRAAIDPGQAEKWARRLPVPFRSQKWEDPKISGSVCSPTSTAMVMAYHGVNVPTAMVCATLWDREYRIYGNWWRAVQGAYSHGVPGYLERFGDWNAVKRHIAAGRPVIASIRASQDELQNAPYRESDGHLLVITGFDAGGNVAVNDPAAATPEQGVTTYRREDMEKVWLQRGGVGCVLLPR